MSVRVSHCPWRTTEVTGLTQELFKHDEEAQSGRKADVLLEGWGISLVPVSLPSCPSLVL